MALVVNDLADALKSSLGFGAVSTPSQTTGFAKSVIDETTAALVNNASGTITGTAPSSGGPLQNGAGAGGVITGMNPASLTIRFVSNMGFPSASAELVQFATSICAHFQTGLVSFSTGTITGNCTNSPTSAGTLAGTGTGGMITGLDGSTLATLVAVVYGGIVSPQLLSFCTTLVTYTMTNASVTYTSGTITATCSAGGGPIIAGTGIGGTIL